MDRYLWVAWGFIFIHWFCTFSRHISTLSIPKRILDVSWMSMRSIETRIFGGNVAFWHDCLSPYPFIIVSKTDAQVRIHHFFFLFFRYQISSICVDENQSWDVKILETNRPDHPADSNKLITLVVVHLISICHAFFCIAIDHPVSFNKINMAFFFFCIVKKE